MADTERTAVSCGLGMLARPTDSMWYCMVLSRVIRTRAVSPAATNTDESSTAPTARPP
jgi:hypothetical protein